MTLDRVKLKPRTYSKLLRSKGVLDDLAKRGGRVAGQVRSELAPIIDDPDWDIVVDPHVGRARANVVVSGVPMRIEEDHRILGRAMDAAR